jgi:hypothetical protein
VISGVRGRGRYEEGQLEALRAWPGARAAGSAAQVIPHHETFSTTIQPPYNSTKG